MYSDNNYQDFFRQKIYDRFVTFLRNKIGCAQVIALIGDKPIFNKKGVHYQLRRLFNEFLNNNKDIEKIFLANDQKCYQQRNICNQPLAFPVDVNDDELMVKCHLRKPIAILPEFEFERATKHDKKNVEPFKGQVLKGDWKEKNFIAPKKMIVHFKRAYATTIGKTTVVFTVKSKEEIADILFDSYKDKVAFAQCEGHKFEFVKRKRSSHGEKNHSTL